MSDVFLSYASEDRDRVETLVSALEASGLSVWWDRAIQVGSSYDDAIEEALNEARCVVTVWTERSIQSRWVKNESMVGMERGLLVPVLLDDVEPPVAFKAMQAADLRRWNGSIAALPAEFLAAVESIVAGRPVDHTPTLTPRVRLPRKRFGLRLGSVLLGLGVTGILVWQLTLRSTDETNVHSKPYLLVVPFDVSTADDAPWGPFAVQVTREIIRNLRKVSGLRVVPPPSAFTFAANKTRRYIREQIPDVRYVLDGLISIQPPNDIRIALTLEDLAADGQVVWDETYLSRSDSTDLFGIQAQVAKSVSSSLKVAILAAEEYALDELPTHDLQAYALYIEGLEHQARATNESLIQSIERFDAAIQRDSEFALAHIAKAESFRVRLGYYEPPAEMLSHVLAAATDALAVNPDSAEARSALGLAYVHSWRWRDAWRYLNDANARDPTIAITHLGFALYYVALGEKQRALDALAEADRLDPLNVEIADWGQFVITMTGDYDRAIARADEITRLFPDVGFVFADASLSNSLAGNHQKAVTLAEKGALLDQRGPFSLLLLAQAYARAGRIEDARAALAEAERSETYVCPYETATAHIALGNLERAFELLIDRAVAIRSNCLIFTRQDPRLEPLRPDPRFAELLETLGLDDASIRDYER